jgi:hypothetical protein
MKAFYIATRGALIEQYLAKYPDTLVPVDRNEITPGVIVFVPTEKQDDGTLLSGAVLFGKGVVPPM